MGWEVRFRPSGERGSLSSSIVSSYPDALTHARILLDRDRGGAVEVREEGSNRRVVYRLTNRGMVALGQVSPFGGQPA